MTTGYKHGRWTHCSSTLSLDVLPVAPSTHHYPPLIPPTSSWHSPLCFLGQQLEPTSMFFHLLNSLPQTSGWLVPTFPLSLPVQVLFLSKRPSLTTASSTTLSPFSLPLLFSMALTALTYCWYIFVGLYAPISS